MEVEQCQAYIFIPLQEMKGSNESMEMDHKENVGSFRSETEAVPKYCRSQRVIARGPKSKYFVLLYCAAGPVSYPPAVWIQLINSNIINYFFISCAAHHSHCGVYHSLDGVRQKLSGCILNLQILQSKCLRQKMNKKS